MPERTYHDDPGYTLPYQTRYAYARKSGVSQRNAVILANQYAIHVLRDSCDVDENGHCRHARQAVQKRQS